MNKNIKVDFGILGSLEIKNNEAQFGDDFEDVISKTSEEGLPDEYSFLIEELNSIKDQREQINFLNKAINDSAPYTDDMVAFNKRDHWATPKELLEKGGDCEDYAISKFLILQQIGFKGKDLRVVIVRDKKKRLLHAICTVPIEDDIFVMDNTFDEPVSHIRLMKYIPLYSYNRENQWSHIVTNKIRADFITLEMENKGL